MAANTIKWNAAIAVSGCEFILRETPSGACEGNKSVSDMESNLNIKMACIRKH